MVAEGSLDELRGGVDDAFHDDLSMGGHADGDRPGRDEFDGFAIEEARHENFADAGRQRGGRGVGQR